MTDLVPDGLGTVKGLSVDEQTLVALSMDHPARSSDGVEDEVLRNTLDYEEHTPPDEVDKYLFAMLVNLVILVVTLVLSGTKTFSASLRSSTIYGVQYNFQSCVAWRRKWVPLLYL